MSCFILQDRTFLPWRLLAFGKTYQLRSHGITELTLRCYSLNKHNPNLHFEGWVTFLHRPFQLQAISFQSHMVTSRPRGWKMKAESSKALLRWAPQALECQRQAESKGAFPAHPWHQGAAPSGRDQTQSLIFWDTRANTSLLPERHEHLRQLHKWNQKRSLEIKQPKSF